jgi:hypothetical protein
MLPSSVTAALALLPTIGPPGDADYWQPPEDVFPILGWVNPLGEHASKSESYERMVDAGFTIIHHATETSARLAEDAGMHVLVTLGTPDPETEEGRTTIEETVAKWKDDAACVGYSLRDEPSAVDFSLLGRITRHVEALDPKAVSFINLFPNYANEQQLGAPTYEEHVERYLTEVKPRVLCFDHYALVGAADIRPGYYENLEIIRAASLKHDVPFWAFALVTPHYSYRDPSEAEIRFQMLSNTVYGAKGAFYFTYWTLTTEINAAYEGWGPAVVDPDGEPTHHYEAVRALNRKLQAWGPTLLRLTSTEVRHIGGVPQGARAFPEDQARGGDFIVGEFTHEAGDDYLIAMNKNVAGRQTLSIRLPGVSRLDEVSEETGELIPGERQGRPVFEITLKPGDARLFRLVE